MPTDPERNGLTAKGRLVIMSALGYVLDEGSDEHVSALEARIQDLRETIDSRMKLVDRLTARQTALQQALEEAESLPESQLRELLTALFASSLAYLRRRVCEIRPTQELRRKTELSADLAIIRSTCRLAGILQKTFSEELYG